MPDVTSLKASVRKRDGLRCTSCGMTNDEHAERYGRQLHVHRLVPGSLYTIAGCVTVCFACHGKLPKRAPGKPDLDKADRPSVVFRAPPDLATRLDYVAKRLGLDVSNLVRMILYENLAQYEERAKQIDREAQKD